MKITGKDTPKGKLWTIEATFKKINDNHINLDFSSKGGPPDITANIMKDKIVFEDKNIWSKVEI